MATTPPSLFGRFRRRMSDAFKVVLGALAMSSRSALGSKEYSVNQNEPLDNPEKNADTTQTLRQNNKRPLPADPYKRAYVAGRAMSELYDEDNPYSTIKDVKEVHETASEEQGAQSRGAEASYDTIKAAGDMRQSSALEAESSEYDELPDESPYSTIPETQTQTASRQSTVAADPAGMSAAAPEAQRASAEPGYVTSADMAVMQAAANPKMATPYAVVNVMHNSLESPNESAEMQQPDLSGYDILPDSPEIRAMFAKRSELLPSDTLRPLSSITPMHKRASSVAHETRM